MVFPARGSARLLLAAVPSLVAACSAGGERDDATAAASAAPTAGSLPSVAMAVDPRNVDVAKLRVADPGDRVVVQARGRPFIRAEEYNAWLGTYPLAITDADEAGAQRQAVDQMVTFRLLLDRAIAAGYGSKAGAASDAKSIVLRYLGDQVRNVGGVSDAEAERYYEENREMFRALDTPEVPPEIRLAALKGSLRGAQLASQLEENKKEADVVILLPASGSPERNQE
jgi:hypothetical protein